MSTQNFVLKPGEVVEAECAAGTTPALSVGQRLQSNPKAEEKTDDFSVLKIAENHFTLGPLKPGIFEFDVSCLKADATKGENTKLNVTVQALPPNQLPERAAPLDPFAFKYPAWIWMLLLGLLMALLCGAAIAAYRAWRRKNKSSAFEKAPPLPPDLAFDEFLKRSERGKAVEMVEGEAARALYVDGNHTLRAYLEFRLHFDGSACTTREFVSLLNAALRNEANPRPDPTLNVAKLIEGALNQSDAVRFAKERPPLEARRHYLETLRKIYRAFPARALSDTVNASIPEGGAAP